MLQIERFLPKPSPGDDKYTRGVVGFITGSEAYPGAALLGVSAAVRCGVGLVRYLGPSTVANLVIENRPEVVTQDGKADVWVIGSGWQAGYLDAESACNQIREHLGIARSAVLDAGALDSVDIANTPIRTVLTPHFGELSRLLARFGLDISSSVVAEAPAEYASRAAEISGRTLLLKGHLNYLATPNGKVRQIGPFSSYLATAGSGDVLAGMLGAVLALNANFIAESEDNFLEAITFTAAFHSECAEFASKSGPVAAMDLVSAARELIARVN